MAHQAKPLTAVGAGLAVLALTAFSGSAVSASDRLTGATQFEPIIVAEKSTKGTKSGTKTTTQPDGPRKPRGSFSGG